MKRIIFYLGETKKNYLYPLLRQLEACFVKYIVRGQLGKTRLESLKDRGEIMHKIPNLTPTEINRYLNWRNVTLQKRGIYETTIDT